MYCRFSLVAEKISKQWLKHLLWKMQNIKRIFVSPICCVHWLCLLMAEGLLCPHYQIQLERWDINKKLMAHNTFIWKKSIKISVLKWKYHIFSLSYHSRCLPLLFSSMSAAAEVETVFLDWVHEWHLEGWLWQQQNLMAITHVGKYQILCKVFHTIMPNA